MRVLCCSTALALTLPTKAIATATDLQNLPVSVSVCVYIMRYCTTDTHKLTVRQQEQSTSAALVALVLRFTIKFPSQWKPSASNAATAIVSAFGFGCRTTEKQKRRRQQQKQAFAFFFTTSSSFCFVSVHLHLFIWLAVFTFSLPGRPTAFPLYLPFYFLLVQVHLFSSSFSFFSFLTDWTEVQSRREQPKSKITTTE